MPARLLTEQRVRRLHRQGDVVLGGYALTRTEWRTLARVGADGVVTPDVAAYRALAGLTSARPPRAAARPSRLESTG